MTAPLLRRYRSTWTQVIGWTVVVVAALSLVDTAVRATSGARVGSGLLAVGLALVAWVWALRPAVQETATALEVVNPLRTTVMPWGSITDVEGVDVVRVTAGSLTVRCFAIPRRIGPGRRPAPGEPPRDPAAEFAADPVIRFGQLRDELARPEDGAAVQRWDAPAVAALAVGLALAVLGAVLVATG